MSKKDRPRLAGYKSRPEMERDGATFAKAIMYAKDAFKEIRDLVAPYSVGLATMTKRGKAMARVRDICDLFLGNVNVQESGKRNGNP